MQTSARKPSFPGSDELAGSSMDLPIDRAASDTAAQNIVNVFDALASRPRHDALHAILDQLKIHEWRHVLARLDQVRLEHSHDIVSSLPLELLIQVVDYLHVTDIVRSQRVSKRWRAIFSCDAVTKLFLRPTLEFLGMETADVSVADAMTYFRWGHGLQCARPIKKLFLPWTALMTLPSDVSYHSRRLCHFVPERAIKLEMVDLETGEKSSWANETDVGTFHFKLSDRYLVMITPGFVCRVLTALDLRTSQKLVKRFPPFLAEVSIEKNKVIIVDICSKQPRPVYIWDLSSNLLREVGSFGFITLWHLEVDDNILVAFEINWDEHPPKVQQTKWTLTGQQLEKKHFDLPLGGGRVDKARFELPSVYSHRACGHKTVSVVTSSIDDHVTMHLVYDYAVDQLSIRWIECAEPINQDTAEIDWAPLTPYIFYRLHKADGRLAIYDAINGKATLHSLDELGIREVHADGMCDCEPVAPWARRGAANSWSGTWVPFGDREVFGLAGKCGVQLCFFNPDFVPDLPGAVPCP